MIGVEFWLGFCLSQNNWAEFLTSKHQLQLGAVFGRKRWRHDRSCKHRRRYSITTMKPVNTPHHLVSLIFRFKYKSFSLFYSPPIRWSSSMWSSCQLIVLLLLFYVERRNSLREHWSFLLCLMMTFQDCCLILVIYFKVFTCNVCVGLPQFCR